MPRSDDGPDDHGDGRPDPLAGLGWGIRRMAPEHLPLLHGWLHQPHVRRWWDDVPETVAGVAAEYHPDNPENAHLEQWLIEVVPGGPVGWIQWYRVADEPDYAPGLAVPPGAVAIDLLIGDPSFVGKGLGPRILDQVTRSDIAERFPDCTEIWIDPDPRNERAMHAYRWVGFEDTGIDLPDDDHPGQVRRLLVLHRRSERARPDRWRGPDPGRPR